MPGGSSILSGLSSPRRQRQLFFASAGILLIGAIAITITLLKSNGNKFTDTFSTVKAQVAKPDPDAPITKTELGVARKFIETAVMRKNLDSAYDLVDVDLRGRMSRKAWATGNIPVIAFQAGNAKSAHFVVDYSRQRSALLEVDLVAKPGSDTRPSLLFFLGLKREHDTANGRWLVSYWEPHWHPPIPAGIN